MVILSCQTVIEWPTLRTISILRHRKQIRFRVANVSTLSFFLPVSLSFFFGGMFQGDFFASFIEYVGWSETKRMERSYF